MTILAVLWVCFLRKGILLLIRSGDNRGVSGLEMVWVKRANYEGEIRPGTIKLSNAASYVML